MKAMIKTVAAVATLVLATPAFAGGVTVAEKGDSKLELSGKAFINFTSSTTENNTTGAKTASSTGLAVDRFYFQAKYHINDMWYGRITTDVNNEQPNATGLKRQMNVFLKYAYIEGKFSDAAQLRLGLSHTPWIDYEQGLWKHRYVAKVASDHFGYDDSADYGVGLKGKLVDGMVSYWVTATNGGGYSKPNKTDGIDYNTRLTITPIKGLDISAQYRTGYRGAKVFGAAAPARQDLIQAMVSYGVHNWRAGLNYLKNTNDLNTLDNQAYSLWGWGKFNDDFGAFARYDREKNMLATVSSTDTQYMLGLEYFAAKGMTFSAAYTLRDNKQNNTKVKTAGLYSQFKF